MSKPKGKTATVLDTLRLFKEKADELRSSSYLKQLPDQTWAIRFNDPTSENGISIVDIRPDDESRKALILTLRFFENELKLENVVALYKDLPIPEDQRRCVVESFERVQKKLASGLQFILKVGNKTYKSREIFETLMYGQYCHPQEPLRKRLKLFKTSQVTWMMANQEFDKTIGLYCEYIFWLYDKNDIAIKALETLRSVQEPGPSSSPPLS
jgi:hypothetical protein